MISPKKKNKPNKIVSKGLEKILYSPQKNSDKKVLPKPLEQNSSEFENFQKHIRSKFGYNIKKKIGRTN